MRDEIRRHFAPSLIAWQRQHGRHGLPWQGTRDPYRVWLSEIMLQQTQVSTVLDYYPRFLARFPDVQSLASAQPDEVMALWSGLGYYSRARNLHRCAQQVVSVHGGEFPRDALKLETLPGIGASTAAAIAAFCHGERVSILDGNVRRVLARLLAFDGDQALPKVHREMWDMAQALLPEMPAHDDMAAYTQGLMDLGATVCVRGQPRCSACPMQNVCEAHRAGRTADFPVKSKRVARRFERWWLWWVERVAPHGEREVWLVRRPERGIWAGLYCLPVFDSEEALLGTAGVEAGALEFFPALSHALTHRELQLHAVRQEQAAWDESTLPEGQWVPMAALGGFGLPAPVRLLLQPQPPLFAGQ
jgi:A/G-specific adenine glycosylase